MKFAVVEYTSKSGGIWRHQAKRPNYLANPVTEIDPTSFGCYVSALEGEHVPLTGLIVGQLSKEVGKVAVKWRKVFKRVTGTWPHSYSINYLRKFDVLLVVHQLSDAHEMVALIAKIRTVLPAMIVVGVPTQPYGILRSAVNKQAKKKSELVQFITSCDVFISVVRETVDWYEMIADKEIVYLPQPYPYLFTRSKFVSKENKDKVIMVAGVTQRDNIIKGQKVAKKLQEKYPEHKILVPKVADLDYDDRELMGANFAMLPFESWRKHLKTLARASLVINTDYTFTRGRVQTDCAAVGTPSIGANSDGQRDLYPGLYRRAPGSVNELVEQGDKLLRDEGFYNQVVNKARTRLEKYSYRQTAERLAVLVEKESKL